MTASFETLRLTTPTVVARQELVADGVTPKTLRGPAWRRIAYGLYLPTAAYRSPSGDPAQPGTGEAVDRGELSGGLDTVQRIDAAAKLIGDGGVISGWAAGFVHGVDWFDGVNPFDRGEMPIECLGLKRRDQLPLVRYRHSSTEGDSLEDVGGIKITSLERTAFDGARWAPSFEEAVVFLDAMLAKTAVSYDGLVDYFGLQRRRVGINQAKAALKFARPGVLSTWESRLRVCYCCQAGLPEPMINVPVFWGSKLLGRPDLFDPSAALATEYDGEHHRNRVQQHSDNVREERFEAANAVMTHYSVLDLRDDRVPLIRRLRTAYQRGLDRRPARDRWTLDQPAWWGRTQSE